QREPVTYHNTAKGASHLLLHSKGSQSLTITQQKEPVTYHNTAKGSSHLP
ncbi:hypothetical protein CAPTEDRAFT_94466, partial [Capitella teleta]